MDTFNDCPYMDDENIEVINYDDERKKHYNKTYMKCETSGKYIHQSFIKNGDCQCDDSSQSFLCEDEFLEINYLKKTILFQHICDGYIDLSPIIIEGENYTDETECQQWKCNNIYTRCNNLWNCPNGEDEIGCISYSTLNCSSKEHLCVKIDTNQLICLPIEKANDGIIDCLGATDEPTFCGTNIQAVPGMAKDMPPFYCMNQIKRLCLQDNQLCNGRNNCKHGDIVQQIEHLIVFAIGNTILRLLLSRNFSVIIDYTKELGK
jgi:hypothetical protein